MPQPLAPLASAQSLSSDHQRTWLAQAYNNSLPQPGVIGLKVSLLTEQGQLTVADNPAYALENSPTLGSVPELVSLRIEQEVLTVVILYRPKQNGAVAQTFTTSFALSPRSVRLTSQTTEQIRLLENTRSVAVLDYSTGVVTHQRFKLDSGQPWTQASKQTLEPNQQIDLSTMGDLLSFSPRVIQQKLY